MISRYHHDSRKVELRSGPIVKELNETHIVISNLNPPLHKIYMEEFGKLCKN
jgi:hypothetical protein